MKITNETRLSVRDEKSLTEALLDYDGASQLSDEQLLFVKKAKDYKLNVAVIEKVEMGEQVNPPVVTKSDLKYLRTFLKIYRVNNLNKKRKAELNKEVQKEKAKNRRELNHLKYLIGGAVMKFSDERYMNFIILLFEKNLIDQKELHKFGITRLDDSVVIMRYKGVEKTYNLAYE